MYEKYTRQALPPKEYRELLGSAICVFNSNNSFVIENILSHDTHGAYSWHDLIDRTSGRLKQPIKETITKAYSEKIAILFEKLTDKRNRIIHSFQITNAKGEQALATKDKAHRQYEITTDFLMEFIQENEALSSMLHDFRGH